MLVSLVSGKPCRRQALQAAGYLGGRHYRQTVYAAGLIGGSLIGGSPCRWWALYEVDLTVSGLYRQRAYRHSK